MIEYRVEGMWNGTKYSQHRTKLAALRQYGFLMGRGIATKIIEVRG